MGDGLRRAATAANVARKAKCPVCGKEVKLRVQAMKPRIPFHGPPGNRCEGSGLAAPGEARDGG